VPLSDEDKKELAKLASADYGVPGLGNDSLRDGIIVGSTPGINSHVDFFNVARQVAHHAATEHRLDDGFRGLRMAKVLHTEVREFATCPDQYMIKEMYLELPEADRPSIEDLEIHLFYAIPYGGVAGTNVLPSSLMGTPTEIAEVFDYEKIINYPRFYALGSEVMMEGEVNPGDYIEVEIKDYVEYSFGIFRRKATSSPMITGGEGVGPSGGPGDGRRSGPGQFEDFGPGGGYKPTGVKIAYEIDSYTLDNTGGYIGLTSRKDSPQTDPIPDAMAAINANAAGDSKYSSRPQQFRADIAPYMHRAVKEIRAQGGRYYGVGSFMQPEWKITFQEMRTEGCIKGLHHTGRAFDLHTGAGCMLDPRAIQALEKNGWNANNVPAYHYYISPNGARKWSVYFLSEDPTVPDRTILAFFAPWTGGGTTFCEKVTGRFIDMTAIFAKHGFVVIPAHKGTTVGNDIEAECMGPNGSAALSEGGRKSKLDTTWKSAYQHLEWWHFQFTGDLVRHKTPYAPQLTSVSSLDYIKKRWDTPGRVRWWSHARQRRLKWDDPRATYGYAWG